MAGQSETSRISYPLQVALNDFLTDLAIAQRSAGTIRFYRQKLSVFLAFLESSGITHTDQLDANAIRAFFASQNGRSSGGIHAYWRAVHAFMTFLYREELLEHNPMDRLRAPSNTYRSQRPLPPHSPPISKQLVETLRS